AFVLRERRTADPMLPPKLFADRQFTGANLSTLAVYAALAGFSLFLVLQLQGVLGYDATAAGAAMLPSILVITLLSPRAGARAAQLLAVAALPVAVGLSGTDYAHPAVFTAGYRTALTICAVLFAVGGIVAWLTIRNDVLQPD